MFFIGLLPDSRANLTVEPLEGRTRGLEFLPMVPRGNLSGASHELFRETAQETSQETSQEISHGTSQKTLGGPIRGLLMKTTQ